MLSLKDKLARAEAFIERENARDDAIARSRPAWWNVGKIVLGLMFLTRSVAVASGASWAGAYALAALLFAGGAYLAYEGTRLLIEKRGDAAP